MARKMDVDEMKTFLRNEGLDSEFGKDAAKKVCPHFIMCDNPNCRYYKPMWTSYRWVFCYKSWDILNNHTIRGGMAIPMNHKSPRNSDMDFLELVEVET